MDVIRASGLGEIRPLKSYDVTISLEKYDELQEKRMQNLIIEKMLDNLLETAELNCTKQELIFDYEDIRDFLKSISSVAYKRRLEELNKEEMKDE